MKYLILILLAGSAQASDLTIQYGLGVKGLSELKSQNKMVGLNFSSQITPNVDYRVYSGVGFIDGNAMGMGFGLVGSRVHPFNWLYIENYIGPGFISRHNVKKYLTGYFQFMIQVGLGFQTDVARSAIGVSLIHVSNAGIKLPNQGLDMALLSVRIPL